MGGPSWVFIAYRIESADASTDENYLATVQAAVELQATSTDFAIQVSTPFSVLCNDGYRIINERDRGRRNVDFCVVKIPICHTRKSKWGDFFHFRGF